MNCWHCDTELIWGGDHDVEDSEDYDIVTNLSCPTCNAYVEVYHAIEDNADKQQSFADFMKQVSQLSGLEQRSSKPQVAGSNPAEIANKGPVV